ncbi:hypothetical protein BC629DRAFT_260955 [Irpex lacteus]|nr:hypothetical protein BC629DRAFT_260955 [Irpex lacteus]
MLLRYIATVIGLSALFPLASALQVPTAGTDATVSADVAVESLGPSLGDVVTNLVAEIAHELQSVDPNDLTTPGAEPSFERVRADFRRHGFASDANNVVEKSRNAENDLATELSIFNTVRLSNYIPSRKSC